MATTARTTARRVALGAGALSIAATGGFAVVAAQTSDTGSSAAEYSTTTTSTGSSDSTSQDSTSKDSSGSSSSGLQQGDISRQGDASSNAS